MKEYRCSTCGKEIEGIWAYKKHFDSHPENRVWKREVSEKVAMTDRFVELDDVVEVHRYIVRLLEARADMDTAHHHLLVDVNEQLNDYLMRWWEREVVNNAKASGLGESP
jgi:hypothetical protein